MHKHEGHGWAEEDDVGIFVLVEVFAFQIPVNNVSHLTNGPLGTAVYFRDDNKSKDRRTLPRMICSA